MHKGFNLIPPVAIMLPTFCLNKYVLIADIRKAFHQMEEHPDDRNVTRFFWIEDPNQPIKMPNLKRKKIL